MIRKASGDSSGGVLCHDVPYFADDILDPNLYPRKIRRPVGGPGQLRRSNLSLARPHQSDDEHQKENIRDHQVTHGLAIPANMAVAKHTPAAKASDLPKKSRIAGGRPAVPKKVSWDLDSDDELIVKMKQERYTDIDIANHLKSTGRVRYHHKTINSRYARILKAIDAHEEHRIDIGETFWRAGDDAKLVEAVQKGNVQVQKEIKRIQGKKWEYVAKHLMKAEPEGYYSGGACRKRYTALENGTARIPPEVADRNHNMLNRADGRPDSAPGFSRAARYAHLSRSNRAGRTKANDDDNDHADASHYPRAPFSDANPVFGEASGPYSDVDDGDDGSPLTETSGSESLDEPSPSGPDFLMMMEDQ